MLQRCFSRIFCCPLLYMFVSVELMSMGTDTCFVAFADMRAVLSKVRWMQFLLISLGLTQKVCQLPTKPTLFSEHQLVTGQVWTAPRENIAFANLHTDFILILETCNCSSQPLIQTSFPIFLYEHLTFASTWFIWFDFMWLGMALGLQLIMVAAVICRYDYCQWASSQVLLVDYQDVNTLLIYSRFYCKEIF